MADTAIATAADYADAMLVARRAKSTLVLLLLVALLAQLALFFTARYTDALFTPAGSVAAVAASPATAPGVAVELPATQPGGLAPGAVAPRNKLVDLLHYVVGASGFLGVTLSIVLAFVLLLLVKIMLVGRLIGVARVTGAYCWCLLLVVLLFPWQAFLQSHDFSSRAFMIPGVLYTWDELLAFARFPTDDLTQAILKWARFVGWPVVAVLMLMVIQVKSNRGLRQALGEDDLAALTAATP